MQPIYHFHYDISTSSTHLMGCLNPVSVFYAGFVLHCIAFCVDGKSGLFVGRFREQKRLVNIIHIDALVDQPSIVHRWHHPCTRYLFVSTKTWIRVPTAQWRLALTPRLKRRNILITRTEDKGQHRTCGVTRAVHRRLEYRLWGVRLDTDPSSATSGSTSAVSGLETKQPTHCHAAPAPAAAAVRISSRKTPAMQFLCRHCWHPSYCNPFCLGLASRSHWIPSYTC